MLNAYKMARSPLLESFDLSDGSCDPAVAAKPSLDWCNGHAAGLVDGQALAANAHNALSAEIAQTLADMGFGYAEARAQLLHGLKPLFGAVIRRILPGLADPAYAAQVVTLLYQAAEQDLGSPLELMVNPVHVAALAELLPFAVGMPVMMIGDPAVGRDQAILRSGQAETLLDVGAVLSGAQAALGAIFETVEESASYG